MECTKLLPGFQEKLAVLFHHVILYLNTRQVSSTLRLAEQAFVRKSAGECVTRDTEWQSNNFCRPAGQEVGDRVLGGEVFLDTHQVLQEGGGFTRQTLKEVRVWRVHLQIFKLV